MRLLWLAEQRLGKMPVIRWKRARSKQNKLHQSGFELQIIQKPDFCQKSGSKFWLAVSNQQNSVF